MTVLELLYLSGCPLCLAAPTGNVELFHRHCGAPQYIEQRSRRPLRHLVCRTENRRINNSFFGRWRGIQWRRYSIYCHHVGVLGRSSAIVVTGLCAGGCIIICRRGQGGINGFEGRGRRTVRWWRQRPLKTHFQTVVRSSRVGWRRRCSLGPM